MLEHPGRDNRIDGPVAALGSGPGLGLSRQPHEALVQTEIVPHAVLPALPVVPVVREAFHDVAVDAGQGQSAAGRGTDGHGYQGDVRVGRLLRPARG